MTTHDQPTFATTREDYAAELRNSAIRDALSILRWRSVGVTTTMRVNAAVSLLLDSCHDQARVTR